MTRSHAAEGVRPPNALSRHAWRLAWHGIGAWRIGLGVTINAACPHICRLLLHGSAAPLRGRFSIHLHVICFWGSLHLSAFPCSLRSYPLHALLSEDKLHSWAVCQNACRFSILDCVYD